MAHRKEQIQSTLMKSIATVLGQKLADPRIRGLVSITRVAVTDDRRRAVVFVSVIPERYASRTIHGLNDAAGYVRTQIAKRIRARAIPELAFKLDRSLKVQAEVFAAMAKGMEETRAVTATEQADDASAQESSP